MNFAVIADEPSQPRWNEWVLAARGSVVRLDGPEPVDVVLVAGRCDSAGTDVPELVKERRTVWLIPEAALGSDFVYAQIPLDEEYPDQLRAIWPLRIAPAVIELKRQLAEGRLAAVLHLQLERTIASGPAYAPEVAHAAWLQDADLLRSLAGGDYRQVTAIHSGLSLLGITTASVSLSGAGVPDAMWAFRAGATARAELTITTEKGASVLVWDGEAAPTLTINCQRVPLPESSEPTVAPDEKNTAVIAPPVSRDAKALRSGALSGPPGVTPWSDVVRAFDLLDAAKRSLTRRRTVDLQFESTTERSQFKTHMTTVGCLLLLFTMFGLIGLLFAGRMLDPRDSQQKQSEVAGFVFENDHFDGPVLNSRGQEVMSEIIENYSRRSATILIEGDPHGAESRERLHTVTAALAAVPLPGGEVRTLVRPLGGIWFKRGMVAAWVVLFLPLGIFLGIQCLIQVTPDSSKAVG